MTAPASASTYPPVPCPPAGSVGVLTWNVQHASAARAAQQAAWLARQPAADVLVLTEVSPSAGGQALVQALRGHGYQTHTPPASTRTGNGDYQVVLAARTGRLHPLPGVRPTCLPHRLLAARLHTPTLTLGLVGLYVPSRGPQGQRNRAKRAFQEAVAALLPRLPCLVGQGSPLVVCGDLNVLEPGHQPAHRGVFAAWEYAFYQAFTASGYVDAFRHLHPAAVAHSWYGRRSGAGYRFDHAFITAAHASQLAACAYLHAPRLAGLSDHAALLTALTPP